MKTLARADDLDDLRRRLQSVRPDSPARWGRMSAHQMICHIADALRMAVGDRQVSAASGVLQRTVIKWIALYVPVAWPAGIPTRPEVDQECSGTRPADFAADVATVESLLRRVAAQRKGAWPVHPIFGPLSHRAWLRWAYLHTNHHLRQFGAILLLLLTPACAPAPVGTDRGALGEPSCVGKVWASTDAAQAPGTMRIFLADGTLVIDSCGET